jgi:hemerythrin-like domain-containing protein
MPKPTEILKEEHEIIKRNLNVLEIACQKIKRNEKVSLDLFKKSVDFIKNFADKCHHAKEEECLFPLLERRGIPREFGPIGVMLTEHDMGRNFVKGVVDGINKNNKKTIVENSLAYIQLLRDHIEKENNILFQMADSILTENDNEKLLKEFEKVEKKMGKGVHEKYERLIEELESLVKG